MKRKEIIVKENNGGGITMYAVDAYGNEYAHSGYEYTPKNLMRDISLILNDEDTSEWEGNDLYNEEYIKATRGYYKETFDGYEAADVDITTPLSIEEYMDNHESTKTIIESDGEKIVIHFDRMGCAGTSVLR